MRLIIALCLVLPLSLGACGKKGALYLPDQPAPTTSTQPSQ